MWQSLSRNPQSSAGNKPKQIDGWQEAKFIELHGNSYLVHLPNGVDVSKIWLIFYKSGSFTPSSFAFDINNDGTLQNPLGAIKKMGN